MDYLMDTLSIYLKKLSIYLLVTFSILAVYLVISRYLAPVEARSFWLPLGPGSSAIFLFEIPLVLALLLITYFSKIENRVVRYTVPLIPILSLYIAFDIFYGFLRRSPRVSDMQNIHTILEFSPLMALGAIILGLFVPVSLLFLVWRSYNKYTPKIYMLSMFLRVSALLVILLTIQTKSFAYYHASVFNDMPWSQERVIKTNGKFSSYIFFSNREKENIVTLKEYMSANIDIYSILYPGSIPSTRNIHIIVLESFIDPRLIEYAQFDKSPLSNDLASYLLNNEYGFSHVISPAYGGGTAQAEFELLTGLKAFEKVGSIEFNVMGGGKASSFVNRLRQNNYTTIATIATGSGFFNSNIAYRSLGFDHVYFLKENNDFKKKDDDVMIFDGDVFDYNLSNIKHILKRDAPIINYVLGMYGHHPYDRNTKARPDVITSKHEDGRVERISNQFYYRTKALAKYIRNMLSIDPDSIIYITSDHLPSVLGDGVNYKFDSKTNISLLIDGGVPVDVSGKYYYEIPWLIWDVLTEKQNDRINNEKEMERLYFKVLAESISNSM